MKILRYHEAGFAEELKKLYTRPAVPAAVEKSAAAIIEEVRNRRDAALCDFAEKFDHVKLTPAQFRVTEAEIKAAEKLVSPANRKAIKAALRNVSAFAKATRPKSWKKVCRPGVTLGERFLPLDRVGVYIPGGTAPLVSTVIHTAGIAHAAGVKEIAAATPPGKDGKILPEMLYAMKLAGVTEIYRLGGVYGVAALALGTETVKKVDKIVGPGNAYVTAAKKLLYGEVAIDMVAGPSEILILADETANPEFIAADLLSQSEHGSGLEQAVLVTTSKKILKAAEEAYFRRKESLPKVAAVDKVAANGLFFILAKNLEQAAVIATGYAPEHLEVQIENPEALLPQLRAAGAAFLGNWTPEPAGDFCAGPSHVLPTAGSARRFDGLASAAFFRRTSIVKYTQAAIQKDIETIEHFAAMEQLAAHGLSGTVRRSGKK